MHMLIAQAQPQHFRQWRFFAENNMCAPSLATSSAEF